MKAYLGVGLADAWQSVEKVYGTHFFKSEVKLTNNQLLVLGHADKKRFVCLLGEFVHGLLYCNDLREDRSLRSS
jgi:hypothetical protein